MKKKLLSKPEIKFTFFIYIEQNGKINNINKEANIAITPNNLLSIEREIA
jgi:hypothetical protein